MKMPRQRQGSGARPTLGVDMPSIDERLQRYATAIELATGISASRPQVQKEARAVMAVADAEIAAVRALGEYDRARADALTEEVRALSGAQALQ